jgi:hypothetical protein
MKKIIVSGLALVLFSCTMAFGQSELQGKGTFENVRLLIPIGDKFKATDVMVRFEADRMVVQTMNSSDEIKIFPYSNIKSAEYMVSKGPRYQANTGMIVAANFLAIPLFVQKVERHRLEVLSDRDSALLDLDKDNYKALLSAFEASTGRKVAAEGTLAPVQGLASIGTH